MTKESMAHGRQRRNARQIHGGRFVAKLAPTQVQQELTKRRDPLARQVLEQQTKSGSEAAR